MTTKAEREELLQGNDLISTFIIGYLLANDWVRDDILKNVATKTYLPHRAVVRVELDSEYGQYWVTGEYTSQGENVISGCIACIKINSPLVDATTRMAKFLTDVESEINQSFAVRFIGNKSSSLGVSTRRRGAYAEI